MWVGGGVPPPPPTPPGSLSNSLNMIRIPDGLAGQCIGLMTASSWIRNLVHSVWNRVWHQQGDPPGNWGSNCVDDGCTQPAACSSHFGQGGEKMQMHFFCIFLHIQEPLVFCIFCIFLHFFAYVLPSVSF